MTKRIPVAAAAFLAALLPCTPSEGKGPCGAVAAALPENGSTVTPEMWEYGRAFSFYIDRPVKRRVLRALRRREDQVSTGPVRLERHDSATVPGDTTYCRVTRTFSIQPDLPLDVAQYTIVVEGDIFRVPRRDRDLGAPGDFATSFVVNESGDSP